MCASTHHAVYEACVGQQHGRNMRVADIDTQHPHIAAVPRRPSVTSISATHEQSCPRALARCRQDPHPHQKRGHLAGAEGALATTYADWDSSLHMHILPGGWKTAGLALPGCAGWQNGSRLQPVYK